MHVVPGPRAVEELLRASPHRVRALWVDDRKVPEAVRDLADRANIPIQRKRKDQLESMAGEGLARGLIALADPPRRLDLETLLEESADGPEVLLALDGVQDPQNLGALLRSGEFFGVRAALWSPDRGAPLSPIAVRASAGASERLPLCEVTNLVRSLDHLKEAGWWVLGTVVDAPLVLDAASVAELPDRLVVVMGNEHKGMRRLTRERCDLLATIARAGEVGSLNVSAACAVVLSMVCGRQGPRAD